MTGITPFLWFDSQAEEAAAFYVSIFEDSKLGEITRFGSEGKEIHGQPEGAVMTVSFRIRGQDFVGLNGGPQFKFSEAISFQIHCKSQEEVDHFWTQLGADGGEPGPCGWIKDRFGVSWQVIPIRFFELIRDRDRAAAGRVMDAMLKMGKLDIAALERAFAG